jgi:iron complex transport system ATP-binding protein
MGNIIELKNLIIGYQKGHHAMPIMSFPEINVEKGDFIAIAGVNGIGKSTLIKTLIQLIPKISGDILINSKPASSYSRAKLASLISYVSTEVIHAQQITVRDLVTFGRYPYTNWFGKIESEDKTIVEDAIDLLELRHLASKFIDEISDGERQRAMIARALAQQTDIVILDEPTAFLDLPHKHEIVNLLGKLTREKGKTILFTTHDLAIAIKEADKLWLLSNEGFSQGSPEDLILNGIIAKIFNTPKVTFDNRRGDFAIQKNLKPYFIIKGKMTAALWTRYALEKEGFTALEREDSGYPVISIDQKETGYEWTLLHETISISFNNILDLRRYIRKNFN